MYFYYLDISNYYPLYILQLKFIQKKNLKREFISFRWCSYLPTDKCI